MAVFCQAEVGDDEYSSRQQHVIEEGADPHASLNSDCFFFVGFDSEMKAMHCLVLNIAVLVKDQARSTLSTPTLLALMSLIHPPIKIIQAPD